MWRKARTALLFGLCLCVVAARRRPGGRDGLKPRPGMGAVQNYEDEDEADDGDLDVVQTNQVDDGGDYTSTHVPSTATRAPVWSESQMNSGSWENAQPQQPADPVQHPVTQPEYKQNRNTQPYSYPLAGVTLSGTTTTAPPPTTEPELAMEELTNKATVPNLESENRTILWIDASYKAEDRGLNISSIKECAVWLDYWARNATVDANTTESNSTHPTKRNQTNRTPKLSTSAPDAATKGDADSEEEDDDPPAERMEFEVIDSASRLEELGLDETLLDEYEAVGVLYAEVCGGHERELWFSNPEAARRIGIDDRSPICDPFKEELHPNAETLTGLAVQLNELISNFTKGVQEGFSEADMEFLANATALPELVTVAPESYDSKVLDMLAVTEAPRHLPQRVLLRVRRADAETKVIVEKTGAEAADATTAEPAPLEESSDQDWLEDIAVEDKEIVTVATQPANASADMQEAWIQIDATDGTNPLMYLLSADAAEALHLHVDAHVFRRHKRVVLHLPGVCADYVPTAIDAFNASDFEGIDIEGPIGVNITALELAGVNLTELAETLRNDTEVDGVLDRVFGARTLGGSYILPVLQKNQYDAFSAPIVFQGSAVVVRFGIYIESMSNFQTSTMDYDMDIYLIMSWRDARLVNPYDKPVLVKEEDILEKLWRPDPFFANAKEAEFHEVTFLNFLMRIFSDGVVLYETRIKLKPACNLVLCKYPHDKQTCELLIKSFAYPVETVRFEWFTKKLNAIDKNPDVKLPELYIDRYEPTVCDKQRKSGEFSCLRALFRLKRDVGFHVAQTYIPTSLALMFSWVGVWLPEEFMEGRIGVAITVLLTLSTESAGAREHLPSVSYMKAIDLWFGYITGFVFFTLLQTLFVIGFDKRANQLRKAANKKRSDLTQEYKDALAKKAERYLDKFCRIFYPLTFLLFLIMYYFVFTEGRQDDCISQRE